MQTEGRRAHRNTIYLHEVVLANTIVIMTMIWAGLVSLTLVTYPPISRGFQIVSAGAIAFGL